MFAIVAGLVFSVAFLFATGVIAHMLRLYREKMVAALLFDPMPEQPALVYNLRIRRPRVETRRAAPVATPAAALYA